QRSRASISMRRPGSPNRRHLHSFPPSPRPSGASAHFAFHYASRTGTGERQVNPLGIVLKGGSWYLVAGVQTETRTFRIGRMSEVSVLEEPFEYPKAFDLAGYWAE